MAIMITQEPADLFKKWTLSRNPFIIKAYCDDFVTIAGAKWQRSYNIVGAVNGDTLTLMSSAPMGTVGFSFFDADPVNDLQIRTFGIGLYSTTNEWIDECLIPGLLNNEKFSKYYTARRSGNRLVIESLTYGTSTDIAHSTVGTFGMTTVLTTGGVDITVDDNIRIAMRVNVNETYLQGQYTRSKWFHFDPELDNNTGKVEVDLSEQLDGMIYGSDLPFSGSTPYKVVNTARKVFVEVGVYDSTTGEITGKKITKTLSVLKGGMSIKDLDTGYDGFAAKSGYASGGKFLSNRPATIYTHKSAIDYLSFHLFHENWPAASTADFVVNARVFYTDGTQVDNDIYTISGTTTSYEGTQVVTIPAGFDANNLGDLTPSARPYKYQISIPNFADCVQEFYLLEDTDLGFSLVYTNEYGVAEGIWCEGRRMTAVTHTRDLVETARSIRKTWRQVLLDESNNRKLSPTLEVVTAPLLSTEWRGSLGMALSDRVWIYFNTSYPIPAQLVPGTLQNETVNWEGNHALVIKAKLKLNDETGWSDINKALK